MSEYVITDTDIPGLLDKWYKRIRESQFSHYEAEKYFSRLHLYLGIPAIIFSTIVGTSIFSMIDSTATREAQIAVGMISLVAALLASLQTFLKFSERAEKHRSSAAKYGSLRREIERTKTFLAIQSEDVDVKATIQAINDRLDALAEDSPNVPDRVWLKAEKVMDTEAKR